VPKAALEFGMLTSSSDGLQRQCKECRSRAQEARPGQPAGGVSSCSGKARSSGSGKARSTLKVQTSAAQLHSIGTTPAVVLEHWWSASVHGGVRVRVSAVPGSVAS
jgi:hypothetical protein